MNDKKTDRVISMEDFQREADHQELGLMTVDDIVSKIQENDITEMIAIGENEEGQISFYGNCKTAAKLIFFLEFYKKLVMDSMVPYE
jgi:hypothetical protein